MVAIFTSNVTKSKSGDCSEVWCLVCIISVSGMLVGSFFGYCFGLLEKLYNVFKNVFF